MKKPVLQPADIGFLMHHDAPVSKIIAKFMGSKWSHTFLIAEQTTARTYTVETSDYHVETGWFDRHLADPNVSMVIFRPTKLGLADKQRVVSVAIGTCYHTRYGYLQLLSLGIRRLLMRFGVVVKNFIRQGMVCDHVVLYGYRGTDIPGLMHIDPESIDTEEVYQLLLGLVAQGYFEIVYTQERNAC